MSDNPADSLRRELETEIRHAIFDPNATTRRNVEEALYAWQARAVLAVVEPVLEAARADERERLQQENQELRAEIAAARRDPTRYMQSGAGFRPEFEEELDY